MSDIPKIFHLSWKDTDIVNSDSPIIENGLRNVIALNPDWDVQISTDEEVTEYLQKTVEPKLFKLIKDAHIVAKLDIWRLVKLYAEGGVYMDIDRLYNVPMSTLLEPGVQSILPTSRDYDFSHDLMITAPNSPFIAATIELYFQRRWEGHNNVYFLGPQTYMHGITLALMGEMINTDPGVEKFEEIRAEIAKHSFLRTFREDYPFDTLVFRNFGVLFDHEQEKRKLYANNGMKHWTGEW